MSFATDATKRTDLTTADDAKKAVADLAYTGGWTNTEDALKTCQATLPKNPGPTVKNVILLFTDGIPTKCTQASSDDGAQGGAAKCFGTYTGYYHGKTHTFEHHCNSNKIEWKSGTTPWEDESCTKYANTVATTSKIQGTTIATLFVKTTDDCPSNEEGPGGCYPGNKFLQNQIASDPGLAQEANWDDVTALVGTMANQIVAGIC